MKKENLLVALDLAKQIEKIRWKFGHFIFEIFTPDWDEKKVEKFTSAHKKPEELKYGLSPRGAELYVAEWMKFLGFSSVQVTPEERDGGYDVVADDYIIQVKNWNKGWIGVSYIRELVGVASVLDKRPIFFFRGNISDDALNFAEQAHVPVFSFEPETASLFGINTLAHEFANIWLRKKELVFAIGERAGEAFRAIEFAAESLAKIVSLDPSISQEFSSKLIDASNRVSETSNQLLHWDRQLSQVLISAPTIEDCRECLFEIDQIREHLVSEYRHIENILDEHQTELSVSLSKVYEAYLEQ